MKKLLVTLLLFLCVQINAQPIFSDNGYPEHFIAGTIIGGATSYFVYKKTNNKFKAWLVGAATASVVGYLKEVVDPKWFNRVRSGNDFKYSALGGVLGASIVIPLKRRKPKKMPNITAAFNQSFLEINQ